MSQREDAICLRVSDYSETSQVAHFLTRGCGQVRVIAKGAKRKKSSSGGALDLFCEGELVFIPGKSDSLSTLVEFCEMVSHFGLRGQMARLNAGLYMLELAHELVAESDPHPAVFELLHNGLARLDQADAPTAAVLGYFQWRLLRHVGLLGEMSVCVSCGGAVWPAASGCFSASQGGLLCPNCLVGATGIHRLDSDAMAGLAALMTAEAGGKTSLPDSQADAVNRLLSHHVSQQLGKVLRMTRHVIGPGRKGQQ